MNEKLSRLRDLSRKSMKARRVRIRFTEYVLEKIDVNRVDNMKYYCLYFFYYRRYFMLRKTKFISIPRLWLSVYIEFKLQFAYTCWICINLLQRIHAQPNKRTHLKVGAINSRRQTVNSNCNRLLLLFGLLLETRWLCCNNRKYSASNGWNFDSISYPFSVGNFIHNFSSFS